MKNIVQHSQLYITLMHSPSISDVEIVETSKLEGFRVLQLKKLRVASARCVPDLTQALNS